MRTSDHTGALTIGFWQNKNGQGIIKDQATTGVCPSGTWLRQYAPFQDLSRHGNVCRSGDLRLQPDQGEHEQLRWFDLNAMLKAQMLATALDVYFSDPALGGNKLNATVPIGAVTIDLKHVCSGHFATCSSFVRRLVAFGGATSLTVVQMLAYAASQSNAGGSTGTAGQGDPGAGQGRVRRDQQPGRVRAVTDPYRTRGAPGSEALPGRCQRGY